MKNLDEIKQYCIQICRTLHIPIKEDTPLSYNRRITTKWGYCRKVNHGFEISIAAILGEDTSPTKALLSTVFHELLHTAPGCFNHGKLWKTYAKLIKKETGIKIRQMTGAEELEIKPRYYIKCRTCKGKVRYAFRPRNIKRTCLFCGSHKLSCFEKTENGKVKLWKRP